MRIEVTLRNHDAAPVAGTLRGRFGDVSLRAARDARCPQRTKTVVLDPSTHPALRLRQPRLWWPNGYGEPNLYDVELRFEADGATSDVEAFQAGVRQFTYSEEGGALRMWINGRRFVARGGNWGFPESMLRYRGREYDVAVRYHRDMNFTMIRNWVGQTGDDEFYEACDRHGIVVWQDFWLANPVGRSRSGRRRALHAQRRGHRPADPQPPVGRPLLRPQRRLPAEAARRRDPRSCSPSCMPDVPLHLELGRRRA